MNLFTALVLVAFIWGILRIRNWQAAQEVQAQRHPVPATLVNDLIDQGFPRRAQNAPLAILDDLVDLGYPRQPPPPPVAQHPDSNPDAGSGSSSTSDVEVSQPDAVFFKPGEPQWFADYDGQQHVVALLEDAVRAAQPVPWRGTTALAIEPQLLLGFPGAGKTLLAKILAHELRRRAASLGCASGRFLEVFPADITDVASLDAILKLAQERPGSVLFIDEIHDFLGPISRKLYLVLEENRYQFHGGSGPVLLPPLSIVAGTTDPGKMHAALKRRMTRHQFKPASVDELIGYVLRRGRITRPVAEQIVARTWWGGAPWEPLEIYRLADKASKARGATSIELEDVQRVVTMQELDEFGLRWMDRAVLRALFSRSYTLRSGEVLHAASIADVCAMAQIDQDEYRETVKPRLLARKLLSQRPGFGQCLTSEALERYKHLQEGTAV